MRVQRVEWFPEQTHDLWLQPEDAYLACLFAEALAQGADAVRVLEVGLWKGAWSHTLLMNNPAVRIDAIDPYPGLSRVRDFCLAKTRELNLDGRLSLFENWESLTAAGSNQQPLMAHIDGEHSEEAVRRDLAVASSLLPENAVIIVDDWAYWTFPGVISATIQFMLTGEWRAIVASRSKLYLARTGTAERTQALIKKMALADGAVRLRSFWGDGEESVIPTYIQSPAVLGHNVLLCDRLELELPGRLPKVKRIFSNWVPPAIQKLLQRLLNSRRYRRQSDGY